MNLRKFPLRTTGDTDNNEGGARRRVPDFKMAKDTIAQINDKFRTAILQDTHTNAARGRVFFTQGVASLKFDTQAKILRQVQAYSDFDPEDDPYGEHDFGMIEIKDAPRIYWKIDYYEDASMAFGAEDKATAYRSLMIMLADEY